MVKKDSVVIKSSPYGLTLVLDREISFEQLVREICKKFATSRSFFGTATLVLSIEGRPVSAEEAAVIVEAIQLNSDITISLIEEDNELKNIEMKEKIDRFYYENMYENAKIIMGSVTKKDVVTSDGSIVILGDVKSKAIVQAAGNVIVMGSLEGSVYVGYPEDDKCYIAANQINAAHMQIGKVAGDVKVASKWSFRSRKSESEPYAVVVWEQELLAEPLRSGLLKHL